MHYQSIATGKCFQRFCSYTIAGLVGRSSASKQQHGTQLACWLTVSKCWQVCCLQLDYPLAYGLAAAGRCSHAKVHGRQFCSHIEAMYLELPKILNLAMGIARSLMLVLGNSNNSLAFEHDSLPVCDIAGSQQRIGVQLTQPAVLCSTLISILRSSSLHALIAQAINGTVLYMLYI